VQPSPRGLHVRSTEGDVWIGPAAKGTIATLVRETDETLDRLR